MSCCYVAIFARSKQTLSWLHSTSFYLALSWFCFVGTNCRPVSGAQCVGRDLMPWVQPSTMLNGPQSAYVWIFCCTNEVYKYQLLGRMLTKNGHFSAHSLSCDVRERPLRRALIIRWITSQLGRSQDTSKFLAPVFKSGIQDVNWKQIYIYIVCSSCY